ncbi:hypothetical protein B0I35DRAFT_871 [Stachybotrys elegans]|uniref:F-box domain-containing protein n=1 Tax=Stachybotrys elegans TaxID=80388 RepID=A0A8K0SZZ6_9HYPO|nr:hypothetical protein B0I35DRAFT_871 [Stachybotrys elegans]
MPSSPTSSIIIINRTHITMQKQSVRTKYTLSRVLQMLRRFLPKDPVNGQCHLMKLPVELLAAIIAELPPQSRLTLSLTCKTLHRVVHCAPGASLWMSGPQHLEYLCYISRSMADAWVCEACHGIHSVTYCKNWTCPKSKVDRDIPISAVISSYRPMCPSVVQIAVKWDRLGMLSKKRAKCLEHHLRPRQRTEVFQNDQMPDTKVTTALCAKVVDGRFLYKTVMEFEGEIRTAPERALNKLWICHHQWVVEPIPASHPNHRYWNALEECCQKDGIEVRGSCPACPTDFAVLKTQSCLVVKAWTDLGTGETPIDPLWRSRATIISSPNSEEDCCYKDPGSIRELYESVGFNALADTRARRWKTLSRA